MPSALYRQACVREIAAALLLHRGRAWTGVIESAHSDTMATWLEEIASLTSLEDSPTTVVLPRVPSQWPALLSGHRPVALSGLGALAEVRRGRFAESSPSLKGAALLRAIQASPGLRLLVLLSADERPAVQEAIPALLATADARYQADIELPTDDGRPLHPPSRGEAGLHPGAIAELRDRVSIQRRLVEGTSQTSLKCYWELVLLLGKLEILVGDGAHALPRLARATQQASDTLVRVEALEAIGDLHLSRSSLSQAGASYRLALDRAHAAGHQTVARRLHLRLSQVCARQGNYAQALEHYERGRGAGPSPDASTLDSAIREAQARLAAGAQTPPTRPRGEG